MQVTYKQVADKFKDKGYIYELYSFVPPPPTLDPSRVISFSRHCLVTLEDLKKKHAEIIQKVYGKDWEFWDTWIDYQQYK